MSWYPWWRYLLQSNAYYCDEIASLIPRANPAQLSVAFCQVRDREPDLEQGHSDMCWSH